MPKDDDDDEVTSNAKHPSGPFTPQAVRVQKLGLLLRELARGWGGGCG
jgi:hypothetical protein